MFVAAVVVRTSTSGESPVTVMDSSSWPRASCASTVAMKPEPSFNPCRTMVRKPGNEKVTVYSPPGRVVKR